MADHLPTTVEQAVSALIALLPQEEKGKIATVPEEELFKLHFSLGMWIRNNFGLWEKDSPLLQATQQTHPDDASMVIIRRLAEQLRQPA